MTTLRDPSPYHRHGYAPDSDSLGPSAILAELRDDPDPARVANALLAVREVKLQATVIKDNPPGQRVYIVDSMLLRLAHDVRSVNRRRLALGIEPVEVETYLLQPDIPLEKLPLAIDDVVYSFYRRLCTDAGVVPIDPDRPTISVHFDRDAIRVLRAWG